MHRNKEASANKTIRFSLAVSDRGKTNKLALQGIINYEFREGIVLITDYPLQPGHILQLNRKLNGCQIGEVRRVAVCGTAYMAHIDLKPDR